MKSNFRPVIFTLLLALVGGALAVWAFGMEHANVEMSLAGRDGGANKWHHLRPWLLAIIPLIPAIGGGFYLLGDTLDRYMARGFIRCFLGTFLTLFAILMLNDVNDNLPDFKESENSWVVAASYYASQLPAMIVLILPYTLLISLLYLLGGLSKSCEIVSILQCGRSLPRLAAPLLVAGALASLACLVFNFHWAPQAERYKDGILRGARVGDDGRAGVNDVIFKNENAGRIWQVGFLPSSYAVGSPLENVSIEEFSKPGVVERVITAEGATWDKEDSSWSLKNATMMDYSVLPPVLTKLESPHQITTFLETPWQFLNPTLQPEQRGVPSLSERMRSPELSASEIQRLRTQRYLRFANSLTCLIVVVIAIPLGIVFTKRGTATGVATAIFIAAAMLFCSQVIPAFGEAGYLPPVVAAFGTNLLFGILAVMLINRRIKGYPIYAQLRSLIGLRG